MEGTRVCCETCRYWQPWGDRPYGSCGRIDPLPSAFDTPEDHDNPVAFLSHDLDRPSLVTSPLFYCSEWSNKSFKEAR